MKLTVDRKELKGALDALSRIVPRKHQIPIASNVLLDAKSVSELCVVGTERDSVLSLAGAPFAAFAKVMTPAPPGTKAAIVWDKGEHTGAGDLALPWKPSFEIVYVGGAGWSYPTRRGGVVKVNAVAGCVGSRNDGRRFHPFEKPVDIMLHFCERAPGLVIVDPFMGAGTTGVAAVKRGRKFIGIEIEGRYFDIACRRISDAMRQSDLFVDPVPRPASPEQDELGR